MRPSSSILPIALVATMHHVGHGLDQFLPILGTRAFDALHFAMHELRQILVAGFQQPRRHKAAAIGDDGGHRGQLQRRRQQIALADGHVDGIARIPGLALVAALPVAVRQNAGVRAFHIQRCDAPVAELGREIGQLVHLHLRRERIEIDVR